VFLEVVMGGAPPARVEAGRSAFAEVIGLGAAVDWLGEIGMEAVRAHELELTTYALERLGEFDDITIHGPLDPAARGALVSFALKGVHPHDVSEIIGRKGVCVRAGHHCAQPLMQHLGESATTRASFAVHTTRDEIDQLVDALAEVRRIFA
jgi:cysteine desulfurase/selenocysteine lyase